MKALLYDILLLLVLSLTSCEKQLTYPSVHYLKEADIYVVINTIRDIEIDSTPEYPWANGPNAKSFRFYLSNNLDSLGQDYFDAIFHTTWICPLTIDILKDSIKNIYINDSDIPIVKIVSKNYSIKTYREDYIADTLYHKGYPVNIKWPNGWTDSTIIKKPHFYELVIDPFHYVEAYEHFPAGTAGTEETLEVTKLNVFWDI